MYTEFPTCYNITVWPILGFCVLVSFFFSEIETLGARDIFCILLYHVFTPDFLCYCTILKPALRFTFTVAPLKNINKLFSLFLLCGLLLREHSISDFLVRFLSDNNCTFWVTPAACLLFGQENTLFSLSQKDIFHQSHIYSQWLTLREALPCAFSLWILSTHPLTYFVCGCHKWLMTSCIEVACQQFWSKSRSAAARTPVASVKRLCTPSEPFCMKHIL